MSQSSNHTHPLMPVLEAKVKLMLTETQTLNLEITQLQQENARLRAQLTEWDNTNIESGPH
ncbi:MAG: hypothetical protein HOH02_02755 [Oceanospirillaceae bacterium]|nr:hypothetical protein [Oceanospirillaceae bacterium]MBT4442167.1 hypothetical protein [Oceanospirillaceae bacterium]MBT6076868.1 hypothetical protein [Oceanospirillaceae bacterium]